MRKKDYTALYFTWFGLRWYGTMMTMMIIWCRDMEHNISQALLKRFYWSRHIGKSEFFSFIEACLLFFFFFFHWYHKQHENVRKRRGKVSDLLGFSFGILEVYTDLSLFYIQGYWRSVVFSSWTVDSKKTDDDYYRIRIRTGGMLIMAMMMTEMLPLH